jgi:hypothetical protein
MAKTSGWVVGEEEGAAVVGHQADDLADLGLQVAVLVEQVVPAAQRLVPGHRRHLLVGVLRLAPPQRLAADLVERVGVHGHGHPDAHDAGLKLLAGLRDRRGLAGGGHVVARPALDRLDALGIAPAVERLLHALHGAEGIGTTDDRLIEDAAHALLGGVLRQREGVLLPLMGVAVDVDGILHARHVRGALDLLGVGAADRVGLDVAGLGWVLGRGLDRGARFQSLHGLFS